MSKAIAVLGSALFFVIAPVVLAGFVPWWVTQWEFRPAFFGVDLTRILGGLLIIAGVPGLVDSFARFALEGLGTPAPIAPPQRLVVTGLYRYVRNPIYVALVAVILGQAALFGDQRLFWYGALFWLYVHLCADLRRTDAQANIRHGVRGFPGQRPALDSAAHALASRTTPESFVTRAAPRKGVVACLVVSWRATADEDGHYSFAMVL